MFGNTNEVLFSSVQLEFGVYNLCHVPPKSSEITEQTLEIYFPNLKETYLPTIIPPHLAETFKFKLF
jgi:hypothetical protein